MSTPDAVEIEVKLAAPSPGALEELAALRELGAYQLEPGGAQDQRNTYYDTPGGRVAASRGGLRVREVGGRRIATVKSAGQARDGLHERGEWEVALDGVPEGGDAHEARPELWPPSEARERALALAAGEPLRPVVAVRTLRRRLFALRAGRRVAELCLDEGVIAAAGAELPFREVEVELLAGGERADLEALAGLLRARLALVPEDRSKLARGLELLRAAHSPADAAPPALPEIALGLFDAAAAAHGLPPAARRALQLAAAAYAAACAAGAANPARAARDAVLSRRAEGLSPADLAAAAAAVALQRDRPRPDREPALLRLRRRERTAAARLAALLRTAAALERAPHARVTATADATSIALGGPAAAEAARLADARGDLWRQEIGELSVTAAPEGEPPPPLAAAGEELPAPPIPNGLRPDEPAAEGARRVLRRFFERMLAREEDVLRGEDPEDVHQMRVSTRRLRASLQVLADALDPQATAPFRRDLRRAAAALGAVRDTDVFLASVAAHRAALPEPERAALDPLEAALRAERGPARRRLAAALGGRRHARFRRRFAAFLTTPGAGLAALPAATPPPAVRDVAGSAIWRRYEQLRAFGPALDGAPDETLHQARIAGKRLRYALELFADALGDGAEDALAPLAELQEALGALQDAVVARARVAELGLAEDPGARGYLAALAASGARGASDLPRVWEAVAGPAYARRLLGLIAELQMAPVERLQSYMRETAREQYQSERVPPFTAFFNPRDMLTYLNYAIPDAPAGGDLRAPVAALRAAYRARGRRTRLEFVEEFAPGLAPALRAAGLEEEGRQPLMVCAPADLRDPPRPPGLAVSALDASATLASVKEHLATNELGFNPRASGVFTDEDADRFRRGLERGRSFTAYLDGAPAAAGMFNPPRDGLAELVGIATLEPFRRRGVAAALTADMARAAFALGVELCFLTAADEAAGRVYGRAGFRRTATMLAYIEPLATF